MSESAHVPAGDTFEPRIVAFFCNWCTYTASDLAGTSRMTYAPNTRVIRIMCSGRLDPEFVLDALAQGADGVLIGGCHPGDCHYQQGNYKALRRFRLLQRMLDQFGIERDRVRLEWIAASEGDKLQRVTNEMVARVKALGPLNIRRFPRISPAAKPPRIVMPTGDGEASEEAASARTLGARAAAPPLHSEEVPS